MRRFVAIIAFASSLCVGVGLVHAQFTTVIDVPPSFVPFDLGSNTQLNVHTGASFIHTGVNAGASDGSSSNVEVNVFGGAANGFDAYQGSTINIFGGNVGFGLTANTGSLINITGGAIAHAFSAEAGSTVNISGGAMEHEFRAKAGSSVTFVGGEFRLDDAPIAGLNNIGNVVSLNIPTGSLLTGTLADGSPLALSSYTDSIENGTLHLKLSAIPPAGPAVITSPPVAAPHGLRDGQTLWVTSGGAAPDGLTLARGSTLNLGGGVVGNYGEAVGAMINVTGGSVGYFWHLYDDSVMKVSGGALDTMSIHSGSLLEIAGGTFYGIRATDGATLNLVGSSFQLDGVPIGGLTPGQSTAFLGREGWLSGVLADGAPFLFPLNGRDGRLVTLADAHLTLTLVPEPGAAAHLTLGALVSMGIASRSRAMKKLRRA